MKSNYHIFRRTCINIFFKGDFLDFFFYLQMCKYLSSYWPAHEKLSQSSAEAIFRTVLGEPKPSSEQKKYGNSCIFWETSLLEKKSVFPKKLEDWRCTVFV